MTTVKRKDRRVPKEEDFWKDDLDGGEDRDYDKKVASVFVDGDEDSEKGGRVIVESEDEVDIGNIQELQEIKNLIIHQLVISYNLSKVTQYIVDRVLNHLNIEERMEKRLKKIEENVLAMTDSVGGKESGVSKFLIYLVLFFQVIIIVLMLLRLR